MRSETIDKNGPLVSVVIPAYNGEKYISEAIESILNQTYTNLEIIIIDDASEDGTFELIQSYKDPRMITLSNAQNMGISYTTNKAIEMSHGKYIALLDDDDIATPRRIELQVDFLEKRTDIDIVGGAIEYIDEEGNHTSYSFPKSNPKFIKAMLLFCNWKFANDTSMIRKEFIEANKLLFRDGYLGMQDYQFSVEASKKGSLSALDEVLIKYRVHNNNTTKLIFDNNSDARGKLYCKIRRDSLKISGYELDEEQYAILDKILVEKKPSFSSKSEMEGLMDVFKTILNQAKKRNVDYVPELVFVMKQLYSNAIYRSDLFDL